MRNGTDKVVAALKAEVLVGKAIPGSRLPSASEICAKHKISRVTAIKAIRVLETEGLVECVRGKGVFLKNFDRASAIWRIGLLSMDYGGSGMEKEVAFGSYFHEAAELLQREGRAIVRLLKDDLKGGRASAMKLLNGLDGLIVSNGCIDPVTAPILSEWGHPVVVIQHEEIIDLPFHQILPDLKNGFDKAVKLLGRLNINTLLVASDTRYNHENRVKVFLKSLAESPLAGRIATSRLSMERLDADHGRLAGRIFGEQILAAEKLPDAIFSPSDFLSFGIMDSLMAKGLTPGIDFKLISYDNLEGGGLMPFGKPMLTCVENPRDVISRKAASLLLASRAAADETNIIRVPCGFVERESASLRA